MIRGNFWPVVPARVLLSAVFALLACLNASAQLSVNESGSPSFDYPIAVPPGVAGMAPKLSLTYRGGGANGPLGHGWAIQGLSVIARCSGEEAVDGQRTPVRYSTQDKLCLDGQRLIPTDVNGTPQAVAGGDSTGLASAFACRDYRVETDVYSRIRACGSFNSADRGPLFFKVWTKSGQVYSFGAAPGTESHSALIQADSKLVGPVAGAWAVSRIADTLGNAINFKYVQEDIPWGTGSVSSSVKPGRDWGISEISYANSRIVFNYEAGHPRSDKSEVYHAGAKFLSARRLQSISTAISSASGGFVPVKSVRLTYSAGQTGRSRLQSIKECAGDASSTQCLPETTLDYANGASAPSYTPSASFSALQTARLTSNDGKYGTITADFNRDGLTDLLRWSDTSTENELWLSQGDGTFQKSAAFNITEPLVSADGCYQSLAFDVNGDGAVDIVRVPSSRTNSGGNCTVGSTGHFFINNGQGSFTRFAISTGSGPIALDRQQSVAIVREFCGAVHSPPRRDTLSAKPSALCEGSRQAVEWSEGVTYFFLDFDGDGKLDLVTSRLAAKFAIDPGVPDYLSTDPDLQTPFLPCTGCTRVFKGTDGRGGFTEVTPGEIGNYAVYADPGIGANLRAMGNVADQNGDGLLDLISVGTPWTKGSWRSRGDGTFEKSASSTRCELAPDFNGDGKPDCLHPTSIPGHNGVWASDGAGNFEPALAFNLKSTGAEHELEPAYNTPIGQRFGVLLLDVDGDGRQDIVRWHDDPAKNRYFRSNGDGTFINGLGAGDAAFTNAFQGIQLKKSSGEFDMLVGDFTGRGFLEFIRISTQANSTSDVTKQNRLYLPSNTEAPDLLVKVTSSTGALTRLSYASLANSARPGSSDKRYAMDPMPPLPPAGPLPQVIDLSPPVWVVTDVLSDNGLGAAGSQSITTRHAYAGLKADTKGRGLLGFRQVRQQASGPNGEAITTLSTRLQQHPYIGYVARTERRLAALLNDSVVPFSTAENIYCDITTPGAQGAATATSPCQPPSPTTPSIRRPYLYKITETSKEIAGSGGSLPTVVTTNTHFPSGDLQASTTTSTGTSAGISQTVTRTTTNDYFADDVSCDATDQSTCRWVLGRLRQASVTNTVTPDLFASGLKPTLGSSPPPNAGAVSGSAAVLVLGSCTANSPTTAPTAASATCALSNSGTVNASGISYFVQSSTSGMVATGPSTCAAGVASCGNVTLTSPTTTGVYSGTLHVSAAGQTVATSRAFSLEVKASTGAQAGTLTSPLAFANTVVGQNTTLTATLANTGTVALSVTVPTAASVSGTDFSFVSTDCGASVPVNGNCKVTVRFSPTAAAARTGTLTIGTGAGSKVASLTGTGTAQAASATLTPTVLFPSTEIGQNTALPATLRNTGSTPLSVTVPTAASVTGADFSFVSTTCPSSLGAGATCQVTVRFAPSATGTRSGTLSVVTAAGTLSSSLGGTGTGGTSSATLTSPLAFNVIRTGQTAQLPATLTNTGTTALSITVPTAASVTGTDFGFVSTTCTTSLAAGANCTVIVRFTPSAAVARTGTLSVTTSVGVRTASLSGTGSTDAQVASLSGPLVFENTVLGQNRTLKSTLTNASQTVTLTVSPPNAGSVTAGSDFSFVSTTCGATLAPAANCEVVVRFAPTVALPRNGTLTVSTGAGVKSASLSGTGITAQQTATLTTPVAFNNVLLGNASTLPATLRNTSTTVTLTVTPPTAASVTGTDFSFVSTNCGTTLAPGVACDVSLRFMPSAAVARSGNLMFNTGAGQQVALLTGTGASPTQTGILTPSALPFNPVQVSLSAIQSVTLRNTSTTVVLNVTPLTATSVTGADFSFASTNCGSSLSPNSECQVFVRFSPTAVANRTGLLTVNTGAGTMTTSLTGSGANSSQRATLTQTVAFGTSIQVGQSSIQEATLTNTSATETLTVSPPNASSVTGTDYAFVSTSCTAAVAPNGSCTVSMRLSPTAVATRTGTLTINTGAGQLNAHLTGAGVAPVQAATISPVAFGDVLMGNSRTLNATLRNTSATATLSVTPPTAASVAGADFSFISTDCTSSLGPNASCDIAVRFIPSATTTRNGFLTVNTGAGTQTSALSGTGTLPQQTGTLTPTVPFGNVPIGQTPTAKAYLQNTSTTVTLNLTAPTAASVSGTNFSFVSTTCGSSLAPSANCEVVVRFSPSSAVTRSGTLSISTGAGAMTSNLSGTGTSTGTPSATVTSAHFGNVLLGNASTMPVTLRNTSATAMLSITPPTAASVSGTDFSFISTTCLSTLDPGAECTVTLRFMPTAAVGRGGLMTINTSAGQQLSSLSGTGTLPTQTGTLSPVAFGSSTLVGQNSTLPATLTNTSSNVVLNVTPPTAMSVTGMDFSFVSTDCGSSLNPGASCTVTVRFSPSAQVSRSGTLAFNTGAGTMTASLTGTGAANVQAGTLSAVPFGDVLMGNARTLDATLTNTSTAVTLVVTPPTPAAVSGADFSFLSSNCGNTLAPQAQCTVTVRFIPTTTGSRNGTLTVSTGAAQLTSALTGNGTLPQQTGNLSPVAFGPLPVGQTVTQIATLQNTSTSVYLNVTPPTAASVSGADFSFVSTNCGSSLNPNTSCSVTVRFSPTAAVNRTGTLSFSTGAGLMTSSLSGTGTGGVQSGTVSAINFGDVLLGNALTLPATVTNTSSTVPLSLVSASTTGADFSYITTNCPATLPPSTSCTAQVRFMPSGTGSRSGTLSVASGAGPLTASLVGNGTLPVQTGNLIGVAFSPLPVGQSVTQNATLQNTSASVYLNVTPPTAGSVSGTDFSFVSTNCGSSLPPGASCAVTVRFSPTATTSRSGAVTVNTGAGQMSAVLSGTGTAASASIVPSPTSLPFGSVIPGSIQTLNLAVTSNGAATATGGGFEIVGQTGANWAGSFSAQVGAWGGLPACSGTIPAGTTCGLIVTYTATCLDGSTTAILRLFGDNFPAVQIGLSATTRVGVCQ